VYQRFRALLAARAGSRAFHPLARQTVLQAGSGVFALQRGDEAGPLVVCLHNVTGHDQYVRLPWQALGLRSGATYDLIDQEPVSVQNEPGGVRLRPYQTRWLASGPEDGDQA
jgi:hypothetical protein